MRASPTFSAAIVAILIASLLLACAGGALRTEPDDMTITARVKTALLDDDLIVTPRIDVETTKGVVTLTGRVKTKQEEERAIQVARGVRGVTDVKSALQIEK